VIASCIAVPCIAQLDHLIADPTPDQLDHVELDPSWALKEPGALHELKSVWARKVVLIKAMNQKNARCLDGSPGVYYIRNGIFGGAKKNGTYITKGEDGALTWVCARPDRRQFLVHLRPTRRGSLLVAGTSA